MNLTSYPALLNLSFLAPTLLRLAVGFFLLVLALYQTRHLRAVQNELSYVFGLARHLAWCIIVVELIIGSMLLVGWHTQIAAVCTALLSINMMILSHHFRELTLYPRSTYILIFVISLALPVLGAGIWAFDLHL